MEEHTLHKQTECKQAEKVEGGVLGLTAGGNDTPERSVWFHISGICSSDVAFLLHIGIPLCYGGCSVIILLPQRRIYKKRGNRLPPFPRVEVFALPVFLRSGNAKPTPV